MSLLISVCIYVTPMAISHDNTSPEAHKVLLSVAAVMRTSKENCHCICIGGQIGLEIPVFSIKLAT